MKFHNSDVRFRISQESIDSLFHPHSINQIHELGHVVMRDGTLFRNKKNKSITLSGEIHFQAITRLQLYIDQASQHLGSNLHHKTHAIKELAKYYLIEHFFPNILALKKQIHSQK